jgi:hypothetical protein
MPPGFSDMPGFSAQPATKTNNNKIRTRFISVSINLTPTHYAKISDSMHVIYRKGAERLPHHRAAGQGNTFDQLTKSQHKVLG